MFYLQKDLFNCFLFNWCVQYFSLLGYRDDDDQAGSKTKIWSLT